MAKISKNQNKLLAIIIAIVLVGVVYYVWFYEGTGIGEEDWEPGYIGGGWKKDVLLTTSDGSQRSVVPAPGLKLVHEGETITGVTVVISAKAYTPAGFDAYDEVIIDRGGTSITASFGIDGTETVYWSESKPYAGDVSNPVNDEWFTVYTAFFDLEAAENQATNLPWTGGNMFWLNFAGDINYKGTTATYEGPWQTITGPTLPDLGFTFIGYGIGLEWQDDIDWDPEETITCYQCNGYDLVSDTFSGTECPSEWYSTPPDCGEPPEGVTLTVHDGNPFGPDAVFEVSVSGVSNLGSGTIHIEFDPTYTVDTWSGVGWHSAPGPGLVNILFIYTEPRDGTVNLGHLILSGSGSVTVSPLETSELSDATPQANDIPIEHFVSGTYIP